MANMITAKVEGENAFRIVDDGEQLRPELRNILIDINMMEARMLQAPPGIYLHDILSNLGIVKGYFHLLKRGDGLPEDRCMSVLYRYNRFMEQTAWRP